MTSLHTMAFRDTSLNGHNSIGQELMEATPLENRSKGCLVRISLEQMLEWLWERRCCAISKGRGRWVEVSPVI